MLQTFLSLVCYIIQYRSCISSLLQQLTSGRRSCKALISRPYCIWPLCFNSPKSFEQIISLFTTLNLKVMTSSSGSGTDLSISLIRESLSSLGKHPFTLSHDYLALTVIDKDIRCIRCIKDYPNLMHIDLSDNLIEDLTPLGNLSALVQLKAR